MRDRRPWSYGCERFWRIAAGNMLATFCVAPGGEIREITTICVDQTEFLVSKLKDRGTHQAFGVVTNAQDFMRLLQLELGARIEASNDPQHPSGGTP
jgi:hypothetical protein